MNFILTDDEIEFNEVMHRRYLKELDFDQLKSTFFLFQRQFKMAPFVP